MTTIFKKIPLSIETFFNLSDNPSLSRIRTNVRLVRRIVIVMMAIALLCISGRLLHVPVLASLVTNSRMMSPFSGLCFVLLGINLLALTFRKFRKRISVFLCLFSLFLIIILSLDELIPFIFQYTEEANLYTSRLAGISPFSAIFFLLTVFTFTLIKASAHKRNRIICNAMVMLSLVIIFSCFFMLVGYSYGIPFYHTGKIIPMSFPSTLCFVLLNTGYLVWIGPNSAILRIFMGNSIHAILIRTILPVLVFITILEGWLESLEFFAHSNPVITHVLSACILSAVSILIFIIFSRVISNKISQAVRNKAESEQRFRTIVENTDAGYFFIDKSGIICNVNDAWLKLYKYESRDEIVGKHYSQIQIEDDLEKADTVVANLLKGEAAYFSGEFSRKCRDGSVGYHTFSAKPVRMSGVVTGIEGFIMDTTARKKTEEALQETEKKFQAFFRAMVEGVAVHELVYENGIPVNYRITGTNPAFFKHTGISQTYISGMKATELYDTPEPPFFDIYKRVALTGAPESFEVYFEPMQKYFHISVFSPGKDKFASIFEDITERKEAERKLQYNEFLLKQQNEEYLALNEELNEINERIISINGELVLAKEKAVESDKLKTAFLTNMSHEIRTPMNGIMGYAELLRRGPVSEEKQKKYTDIIVQSGNRLLGIINDILDISRIEAGQMRINEEEIVFNNLLDSLYDFFKDESLCDKNVKITLKKGLTDERSLILTDGVRIQQVISNLLDNALKFTSNGFVEFGYCLKGQNIEVFVKDSGIGIPEEKQKIIFERFRQAEDSISQNYGGNGLGLSISKSLIELMGGTIRVQSAINEGSTFYLTFPYRPIEQNKQSYMNDKENEYARFEGRIILLVEDDLFSAEYVKEVFSPYGIIIIQAKSGLEAVELCKTSDQIKLVLMDIRLPDISGIDATKLIKKEKSLLPVIAQTANAMAEDREKCIQAGCDDYISKPLDINLLKNIVFRFLEKP